jgi:actin-related protein 8
MVYLMLSLVRFSNLHPLVVDQSSLWLISFSNALNLCVRQILLSFFFLVRNVNLLTVPEIKDMLSIVLHDLGFSTAVVHQVRLCLQSPSIFQSLFSFPVIVLYVILLQWCYNNFSLLP